MCTARTQNNTSDNIYPLLGGGYSSPPSIRDLGVSIASLLRPFPAKEIFASRLGREARAVRRRLATVARWIETRHSAAHARNVPPPRLRQDARRASLHVLPTVVVAPQQ